MFARRDGFKYQLPGNAGAADQLDHDIDVRVGNGDSGICHHLDRLADDGAGARRVQIGHHGYADVAPGATHDLGPIALEHLEHAAADSADAEQGDTNGWGR